jgi:hypothetical protein
MQAKEKVKSLTEKLQNRDLDPRPGMTMMESFEQQVNQVLNTARDDAGKLAQSSLDDTNNVVRMVTAGSKGSFINISQVTWLALELHACVILGKCTVYFLTLFNLKSISCCHQVHDLNRGMQINVYYSSCQSKSDEGVGCALCK